MLYSVELTVKMPAYPNNAPYPFTTDVHVQDYAEAVASGVDVEARVLQEVKAHAAELGLTVLAHKVTRIERPAL